MSYPIEFVEIAHIDNTADSSGYGAISYNYSISKYLITNSQFVRYLNEIKNNFFNKDDCYDDRCGIGWNNKVFFVKKDFELKPVAFITPRSAKTFCNYIYNLENDLNLNSYSCYDFNFNKVNDYGYFLPNINQWHKAAFFNGASYNDYPIKDNLSPVYSSVENLKDSQRKENVVNFNNTFDYLDYNGFISNVGDVGTCSSFGVYDMAGNLHELIEENNIFYVAGGSWHSWRTSLLKGKYFEYNGKYFGSTIGLRLVKISK